MQYNQNNNVIIEYKIIKQFFLVFIGFKIKNNNTVTNNALFLYKWYNV